MSSAIIPKILKSPLPPDAQIVGLPIGDGFKIYALYLTRNQALDDFFERKNITVHNVFADTKAQNR